jgi:hypothetical protein
VETDLLAKEVWICSWKKIKKVREKGKVEQEEKKRRKRRYLK